MSGFLAENSSPLNPNELYELGIAAIFSDCGFPSSMLMTFSLNNCKIVSNSNSLVLILIIPSLTKNSIALTNSVSEIASDAHHPAVFFTQSGTPLVLDFPIFVSETSMIFSLTKNSIALTNSVSEIASDAHHPAVFFTQSGTFSAYVFGNIVKKMIIGIINNKRIFMIYCTYTLYYILVKK